MIFYNGSGGASRGGSRTTPNCYWPLTAGGSLGLGEAQRLWQIPVLTLCNNYCSERMLSPRQAGSPLSLHSCGGEDAELLNLAKLSACYCTLDKVEPRFCSRNACIPCALLRCSWLRLQRSRLNPYQSQLGGRLRVRLLCTNQLDFVMPSPATMTRCRPRRPDR